MNPRESSAPNPNERRYQWCMEHQAECRRRGDCWLEPQETLERWVISTGLASLRVTRASGQDFRRQSTERTIIIRAEGG